METEIKAFQIIAKDITNNTKIHIPMKVACYLYIRVEQNIFQLLIKVLLHIEQCDFQVTGVILTKRLPEHHFNMHNNVKHDFIHYI